MMREIKFRVWDNVEKKMLVTVESWNKVWWDDTSPENEYNYHSKCLYIDNQGHVLEHTDEHGMCDMNYLLQGKPKYELMQYTGLKDKNGREIYEGDRLYNGAGYYRTIHLNITRGAWFAGYLRLTKKLASSQIVRGNIYENPELMEAYDAKP